MFAYSGSNRSADIHVVKLVKYKIQEIHVRIPWVTRPADITQVLNMKIILSIDRNMGSLGTVTTCLNYEKTNFPAQVLGHRNTQKPYSITSQ